MGTDTPPLYRYGMSEREGATLREAQGKEPWRVVNRALARFLVFLLLAPAIALHVVVAIGLRGIDVTCAVVAGVANRVAVGLAARRSLAGLTEIVEPASLAGYRHHHLAAIEASGEPRTTRHRDREALAEAQRLPIHAPEAVGRLNGHRARFG
jgi:hypothetical protein